MADRVVFSQLDLSTGPAFLRFKNLQAVHHLSLVFIRKLVVFPRAKSSPLLDLKKTGDTIALLFNGLLPSAFPLPSLL